MTTIHPDELPVRDGYAAWAPHYDGDGNPLIALEQPAVAARFGPVSGQSVLDLGCGTGRHTGALLAAGAAPVVALDFTPEMLAIGRLRLAGEPVTWVQHRLPDPLPLADGSFDLVVMGLVAEHIADLETVLREAHRVARPGARCVVSALHPDRTAAGQTARYIDPTTGVRHPIHTVHRTVEAYLATAAAAGWSLLDETSLVVPPELAEVYPRARPYVGENLGWVGHWVRVSPP